MKLCDSEDLGRRIGDDPGGNVASLGYGKPNYRDNIIRSTADLAFVRTSMLVANRRRYRWWAGRRDKQRGCVHEWMHHQVQKQQ
jgi:hypothetical protein